MRNSANSDGLAFILIIFLLLLFKYWYIIAILAGLTALFWYIIREIRLMREENKHDEVDFL